LQNVRYGGIAHIFAVSGLHVGALFAVCLTLFKGRLQVLPRYVRFLSVAVVLLLYGGVCGYSASILRATVMCLCSYLCRLWFFGSDGLERIGFAGIVVLLISPATLFDIGFQLSFSACLGIVVLYRPISRLCYGLADKIVPPAEDAKDKPRSIPRRIFRFFVGLFTTTVSAQIATAPLLLNTFGFLSGWSLLLNMLFVPIVSALFSLALCVAFVACLLPLSVAPFLLYAPSVVWSALLLLFHVVDFSTFALKSNGISLFSRALYAVACSFLTDKWNLTKGLKILLFCLFLFCFVFSCFFL
jgi:competence protein ComEC